MATLSRRLLDQGLAQISGQTRTGQELMVDAISQSQESGKHALIQAGTGTGKSLGYLAPAFAYAQRYPEAQVVIATATLALQAQLATKDIPTIVQAAHDLELDDISWCVLKGGSNYPCLMKIRDAPIDPQETQYSIDDLDEDQQWDSSSPLATQVVGLRQWAEKQAKESLIADRDDAPSHSGQAWSHVSISGRECVGSSCPYFQQCFVQAARLRASQSNIVVTNHALVAIEADHGWGTINPSLLILDEAHEITARVTTSRTDELSPQRVERAIRLSSTLVNDHLHTQLAEASQRFSDVLETSEEGRVRSGEVIDAVEELSVVLRRALSAVGKESQDPRIEQVANALKEVFDICERIAAHDKTDVIWVSQRLTFGPQLVVAPLEVAQTIRDQILSHQTTILTSATLKLGDSFSAIASSVGLISGPQSNYTAVDVGSPFDYANQGICYVASHLPPPGRQGASDEALAEIADLLEASNGRALGLFSSMRAAEQAAEYCRSRSDQPILLQGEEHLPDLMNQFLADPHTSLFGTLSLWQGVDAPGETCHLVIVDRLPFPRPDEPLFQARQEEAGRQGRNGFMEVAATHAGLMLAQGTGRLIRSQTDRGVVAILDPRLRTARYGSFLMACLPPLWMTEDRQGVLDSLRRLDRASGTHSGDEKESLDR
ncbi:MAG: ATP-dependent DNA helicase [Propionibacteriaceae bacterium]|nr:ATP-dependent DNA helicase [Propionibacteriaceae bacterium]